MSKWKVDSGDLIERAKDYTAYFDCTNLDTGAVVNITMRQDKGRPASDLVGALRVLASLFVKVSNGETPDDKKTIN